MCLCYDKNCVRDLFGQASHSSQARVKPNGRDFGSIYDSPTVE